MDNRVRTGLLAACYLLLTACRLYAVDIGIPTGERGLFSSATKYFFGDYQSSLPNTSVWSSSGVMKTQFLDSAATTQMNSPLIYGTTSWYLDLSVIPGNTYYWWFEADYGATKKKEQSSPGYHTVYTDTSSAYVIFDGTVFSTGAFNSLVLWNNWAGAPPAPDIFEAVRSTGEVNLKWYEPKISGTPALDMFGGGYEIWRSSFSTLVSTTNAVLLNQGAPVLASYAGDYISYSDKTIEPVQAYYYAVRSYDAYSPSLYSAFSQSTSPAGGLWYVSAVFNVDVSKQKDVKTMQIMGDFTDPQWKKIMLNNNGDGTWGAKFGDGTPYVKQGWMLEGRNVSYKYVINDTAVEPDLPAGLGGPNRKITLSDPDKDGVMTVKDIWAAPTLAEGADLPEEICSISVQNTSYYADVLWEAFSSSVSIAGFEVSRSTLSRDSGYAVIATTSTLSATAASFRDYINLAAGVTAYYRIAVVDSSGKKGAVSTPVSQGREVPNPASAAASDGLADLPGSESGTVYLDWSVPADDTSYGPATYFIIRKSTYPVKDYSSWKKEQIVGKKRAHSKFDKEYLNTAPLGEGSPGFYFSVGTIYSSWTAVGLSNPVIAVAPQILPGKTGGTITKANYYLGSSTDGCKTSLAIDKNTVKSSRISGIIRNYYELQTNSAVRNKISEANDKIKSIKQMKFISGNEISPSDTLPARSSTIFAFEIYDDVGNDYFADRDGDGRPEKFAARKMTITLPFADTNGDGIVDSTESDPVRVEDLRVCRLNEAGNFWKPLEDTTYEIDKVNGIVKAQVNELSVYGLFGAGGWADDLSQAAVYPNPFKPYDGILENGESGAGAEYEGINFVNLTKNAKVYIYTIAAELVYNADEVQSAAPVNGKWRWNCRNSSGAEAASGVYVYLIKDNTLSGGKKDKMTGKIVIIR